MRGGPGEAGAGAGKRVMWKWILGMPTPTVRPTQIVLAVLI